MSALLAVEDLRVRFRTMGPLKALATGTSHSARCHLLDDKEQVMPA